MIQEIWIQGYEVNGRDYPASKLAEIEAESFEDALQHLIDTDAEFARRYDRKSNTYWGCLVFGSEEKARIAHG